MAMFNSYVSLPEGKFGCRKMVFQFLFLGLTVSLGKSGEMWVLSVLPGKILLNRSQLPTPPWCVSGVLVFPSLPSLIRVLGWYKAADEIVPKTSPKHWLPGSNIRSMSIFEKKRAKHVQTTSSNRSLRGLVTFDANWVALCSHLRHPCSLATWSPRSASAEDHPR